MTIQTVEEILTMKEIEEKFNSEWVLIGEPQTNELLEVLSGKILFHSKDRDEIHQKAMELRPKRFAVLRIGEPPEGMEFAL